MILSRSTKRVRVGRRGASVRLMPAAMATVAAVLGLKAVAVAQGVSAPAPAQSAAAAPTTAAPAQSAPAGDAAAAQCPAPSFAELAGLSPSEVQVLQALGERRQTLDERASSMDTEAQLLAAAERRLDERLAELRQLETTVNGLLGQLDEAQERRLAELVDVYQRMRAKDAALVFDGLDDAVLVQVASRMREQNLAEVMGRMNPARARALTTMLADMSRPPSNGEDLLNRARTAPGAAALPTAPAPGR